eukprot:1998171-Rhodomonas_salina.2
MMLHVRTTTAKKTGKKKQKKRAGRKLKKSERDRDVEEVVEENLAALRSILDLHTRAQYRTPPSTR